MRSARLCSSASPAVRDRESRFATVDELPPGRPRRKTAAGPDVAPATKVSSATLSLPVEHRHPSRRSRRATVWRRRSASSRPCRRRTARSPAVILVAFFPMAFIAVGYRFMNLADPDAGTTFAWVTSALARRWAGQRLGDLRRRRARDGEPRRGRRQLHLPAVRSACADATSADRRRGRLDHHHDGDLLPRHRAVGPRPVFLLAIEFVTLTVFAIVALVKVYANHPAHSMNPPPPGSTRSISAGAR